MLHSEEIEILLPEKVSEGNDVPALLAIGPSFTMIVPIILMASFSSKLYGNNGNNYMIMSLLTGGSSALMGIVWGISGHLSKRKRYEKKLREVSYEFDSYIDNLRKKLVTYLNENTEYMYERYPTSKEMMERGDFVRFEKDSDYMFLRLGIGACPFQVTLKKQEKKEMFPGSASLKADELIEEFRLLKNVPVGINLDVSAHLGLVGYVDSRVTYECIAEMVLKIALSYESNKVKLCLFYDEGNEYQRSLYESIKFLPHLFVNGISARLCAKDEKSVAGVISNLSEIIDEDRYMLFVFVLNDGLLQGEMLHSVLYEEERKNIKVFTLSKDISSLPLACREVFKLPEEGMRYGYLYENGNRKEYSCQIMSDVLSGGIGKFLIGENDMSIRNLIMDMELDSIDTEYVPLSVNFLNLFDVKTVEDIPIGKMYQKNSSRIRLKAPIGMCGKREKIYLDVHEKFHGPHGLIAGTTGSGKSELLQTYLMSLCLCYSPREVNFFLIDYKGGGTGNCISNLPHCAGVISNLSGNDIQRAMEAIKAENIRRQQLFSKFGVNHIDLYSALVDEGLANEALPHLILIIDEFAELKKEEPNFMQQIISLAAVGRSLGIHLILATQKPQGVVDDKIWSNSKFRLCLKVQDKQDSMDMLHRKDAAYLKNPGECYMQIGNDEYLRCFKAGYCGECSDRQIDDEFGMILEDGARVCNRSKGVGGRMLLEEMTDYVNQFCTNNGYAKAKTLWLDELPESIEFPTGLCKPKTNTADFAKQPDMLQIELGIYDNPALVTQSVAYYSPAVDGHMAIAGSLSTGKTGLLKCIICQITSYPFLIVSLQDSDLLESSEFANCMGVLDCKEGIDIFLYHLNRLNKKQNQKHFVLIDNFPLLYKTLKDEEAENLIRLIQDGIGNNIYYILTGSMLSDFPAKIYSKIKTTLCLEMNDKYQYCDIMRDFRLSVYPKSKIPGRCLYRIGDRVLEMQVFDASKVFEKLKDERKLLPLPSYFPKYRRNPKPDEMLEEYRRSDKYSTDRIPLGYSLKTGYICSVPVIEGGSFIISGSTGSGRHTLMENMMYATKALSSEVRRKVYFADGIKNFDNGKTDFEKMFTVVIVTPGMIQDMMLDSDFRRMIDYGQGIHLGGNAAAQRILSFDDLSYSVLSVRTLPGNGLLRLHGRNSTVRIKIPWGKEEERQDDYD